VSHLPRDKNRIDSTYFVVGCICDTTQNVCLCKQTFTLRFIAFLKHHNNDAPVKSFWNLLRIFFYAGILIETTDVRWPRSDWKQLLRSLTLDSIFPEFLKSSEAATFQRRKDRQISSIRNTRFWSILAW
jgi:hypothetical protein